MKKNYNPNEIEHKIYKKWEEKKYFNFTQDKNKKNFCIMLPPPNITGVLHMGHAFQQTIMDVIIRYKRMNGNNTLWQSGKDHAGIATQIVVEKYLLSKENKSKKDYSRKEFIKKIWLWKEKYSDIISTQIKRLGNSINWGNERFTLDENFSYAVRKAFIILYKNKIIYRKKSLVNWDIKIQTAISDLEIENKKIQGKMWFIKYKFDNKIKTTDGKDYLLIATTRPETIIGDTAVAVNPQDKRFNYLIGKFVKVPILNRVIPIIGDNYCKLNKGTGCVKITPAHHFDDYQIGLRHKLFMINIMKNNGNIRDYLKVYNYKGEKSNFYKKDIPNEFKNISIYLARNIILKKIKSCNLLKKTVFKEINIPYCERTGQIIEPILTNQWYIKSTKLAQPAIEAVKKNNINFIPKKYKKIYLSWMDNIKDWCISRQLWWGHRIPAWYDDKKNIYVGHNEKEIRKKYNIKKNIVLFQDEDVLDTWFSSSLWTFTALGWPQNNKILNMFHPTDVLVTGFDIIFFWVARMVMMSMYFIKDKNKIPQIPFKKVYITGLIKDEKGMKMSKSKGNIIDPLDIVDGISLQKLIEKRTHEMMLPKLKEKIYQSTKKKFPNGIQPHGTDALRFTLLSLASHGRDINWDMNRLKGYRNFCNKLWNVSRFVLKNIKYYDFNNKNIKKNLIDQWIITELYKTIKISHRAIKKYRFDIFSNAIYDFTWNIFCDWYIEISKIIFLTKEKIYEKSSTINTLLYVLKHLLRLAHPIIPFITEHIWQKIKKIQNKKYKTIMFEKFPEYKNKKVNMLAIKNFIFIKQIISNIRNIRCLMNINFKTALNIKIFNIQHQKNYSSIENIYFLKKLGNIKNIDLYCFKINESLKKKYIKNYISKILDNDVELYVKLDCIENKVFLLNKINKEINKIKLKIKLSNQKLKNQSFIKNAPLSIVNKEKIILIKNIKKLQMLEKNQKNFL